MTEICLAKSLGNTLRLQLNKKNRPLKHLMKRARKNKNPFGIPLQKHRGGVWEGSIQNFFSKKYMANRGNYHPATGKKNGFQGKIN